MAHIVWIDLEMTGLDIDKNDKILEIACLVTDADLNILDEGIDIVIHQSEDILLGMNEWCTEHHGASGLTKACLESKIDEKEAENKVLELIKKYIPTSGVAPLAG